MNRDNLAAIDAALARNPRDVAALIAKADQLAGDGDLRSASAYLWRPEISEAERQLISAMFEALDAQGGGRVGWSL
jgi:hypothetical protein